MVKRHDFFSAWGVFPQGVSPIVFLTSLVFCALVVFYLNIPLLSLVLFICALPLGALAFVRLFINKNSQQPKTGLSLILLGISAGCLLGGIQNYLLFREDAASFTGIRTEEVASFHAVVKTDSTAGAQGVTIYFCSLSSVRTKSGDKETQASGTVVVYAKDGPQLRSGEIIDVQGQIRKTAAPSDIRFTANAKARTIERHGFVHPLLALRSTILDAFLKQIRLFGAPASSLFEALFLGVREDLSFDLKDSFVKTGSLHLLALSGLNVGMVVALFMFLMAPFRSRNLKIIMAAVFVLLYLFLAGPEPSLLRAVLMLLLGSIGFFLDRKTNPLAILLGSAVFVMFLDPRSVYSLSFQLSYLALFGILTLGKRIDVFLVPYLPRMIRTMVAAAVSAQLITAPLIFSTFGVVYPIGLVVSLLLIPATTVYIWSGVILLFLLLLPFHFLHEASALLMGIQYTAIDAVSNFFKAVPGISLVWQDWYWIPAFALCLLLTVKQPLRRLRELRCTI
jgi:ComEC/Rec2-related protein